MTHSKFLAVALLASVSLFSCGDDDDRQLGGQVPSPTPSPINGGGQLDWERVTLRTDSCPGEALPHCKVGSFTIDDEGNWNFSSPQGHRGKAEESVVLRLDARVDAIKDSVNSSLNCVPFTGVGPSESITVEFQSQSTVIYQIDNGQICHRGDPGTAQGLIDEVQQLQMKYSCGCFDGICIDCEMPIIQ